MDAPISAASDTAPRPAVVELLVRLLKLGSFVNTPMKEGVCDPAGISSNELKVMMALAGEGALAGHDLVAIMGVPPMNISRALAALRAHGWIEDATDPDNRRRRPVRLSASGWQAYERMAGNIASVADALLGGLSAKQQRDFAALSDVIVGRMVDWIAAHAAGEGE